MRAGTRRPAICFPGTLLMSLLQTPFLTLVDPRAKVKGSRDPLGLQAVWVGLGRTVVGNLTTVSTLVRDFTILMLGAHFVERVRERGSEDSDLRIFLRFELLASYARVECLGMRSGFRGVERASQFLDEPPAGRVTLSAERGGQILQNQQAYGVWGLYTGPGRESSLLLQHEFRLSPAARDHLDGRVLKALRPVEERIVDKLMKDGTELRVGKGGADRKVVEYLSRCLVPEFTAEEQDFYWRHLMLLSESDSTQGRQQRLVRILEPDFDRRWSIPLLRELAQRARLQDDSCGLSECLQHIALCDSLIAPASRLFSYVLACDGLSRGDIAQKIYDKWGNSLEVPELGQFEEIHPRFGEVHPGVEDAWIDVVEALNAADYGRVIDLLITINGHVMKERGGTPWAEWKGERLNVRFRDEESYLPTPQALKEELRFSYFLDSLCHVARQIRGEAQ